MLSILILLSFGWGAGPRPCDGRGTFRIFTVSLAVINSDQQEYLQGHTYPVQ